ncbi:uncharacterized protein LOC130949834 [Arachis stenosperma]|uniref:uncharacterized protein LOC130949834 n=1 Tax=Arachis stenosperma TaxID=217475 RepID=UPI0025ACFCC3|nr:uncharacterized protein LOC130949834 [Arachis stenosperma]
MARIEAMLANFCKEVEDIKKFKEEVVSNRQNQDTATQKLEAQVGYLSKQAPSYNSNGATRTTSREECKAITLRSGRELEEKSRETKEEETGDSSTDKEEAQTPKAPYPQRLMKNAKDSKFSKFLEIFKKLQINIPFAEALEQMPLYAKFLKELMTKKRSWRNNETVILTEECSAIIQHKLPQKLKDPESFQIPCIIGEITVEKALCDLGASINLMSLTMMKRMKIEKAKPTRMALQLADRSFKFPHRI